MANSQLKSAMGKATKKENRGGARAGSGRKKLNKIDLHLTIDKGIASEFKQKNRNVSGAVEKLMKTSLSKKVEAIQKS